MNLLVDRPTLAFFGADSPTDSTATWSPVFCGQFKLCFVHGYETAEKLAQFVVGQYQSLFRSFHTIAFVAPISVWVPKRCEMLAQGTLSSNISLLN